MNKMVCIIDQALIIGQQSLILIYPCIKNSSNDVGNAKNTKVSKTS